MVDGAAIHYWCDGSPRNRSVAVFEAEGAGRIVAGYEDGTINVWGERPFLTAKRPNCRLTAPWLLADASSLALITKKTSAHSKSVVSVAFSPDGSKIVSGSSDKTIKVWGALRAPNCQPNFRF